MFDVVTIGETMVAFEAEDFGPLRHINSFSKWPGGSESNVTIGLARLGFKVGWVSRLGNDEFGQYILSVMRGENIDVSQVKVSPEFKTGVFFVERDIADKFKNYYYRKYSAAAHISPQDINESYFAKAKYIHITGITPLLSNLCYRAIEKVMSLCIQHKIPLSFDPNIRLKIADISSIRKVLVPIMEKSQIILSGAEEITLLFEEKNIDKAIKKALDLLGPDKELVVKNGRKGAIVVVEGKTILVPGFSISRILSSIGAGDAFDAGYLAGRLKNLDIQNSARYGNAMGAFATMGWSPFQTLPHEEQLNAFLEGDSLKQR